MSPFPAPFRPVQPPVVVLVANGSTADILKQTREALACNPGHDIAWVSSSTVLPELWEVRLAKAAWAAPRIGAALPLCDIDPLHALTTSAIPASDPAMVERLDRTAFCLGDRSYYEVPRLHAACAYLRHDALHSVLPLMEGVFADLPVFLSALASRMISSGWTCVLCDYVFVGYVGPCPASSRTETLETKAYRQADPLAALRRAVGNAIANDFAPSSMPGLDGRAVQLHVMHFWGGGVDKWVRDFARADTRINLIFTSYRIGESGGQRLALYSGPDSTYPIRTWDIARPILSTATGSVEYRRVLEQVVHEFSVDTIIVSSLIGHALDALEMPCPTLAVLHDFYPVCQAINPYFGKGCTTCELEDLRACARDNPLNSFFPDQCSESWDALRQRYAGVLVERNITVVVPSPSVSDTLRQLSPRLREIPIRVIPHGIDGFAEHIPFRPPSPGELLRIIVLGRLKLHKGLDLLRRAAPDLVSCARITLVGCGKEGMDLARELGWDAIETYLPDELAAVVAKIQPHGGLLASIVPETFSYTLSELQALGIAPIATNLGSFRDRIEEGVTGFLFEPDPRALIECVRGLSATPSRLEVVANHLALQPPTRSIREMVLDYTVLLPVTVSSVARFAVGTGRQTGLSMPYQQLDIAYKELTAAYAELRQAYTEIDLARTDLGNAYEQSRNESERVRNEYEHVRNEYEHVRNEYDQEHLEYLRIEDEMNQANSTIEEWQKKIDALDVQRCWWRFRQANQLTIELRNKMRPVVPESGHQDPEN